MRKNKTTKKPGKEGLSTKAVEMIVASIIFLLGIVVVYDSHRVGSGWASDGPQAGYFPFYIGVIICIAGGWIVLQTLFGKAANTTAFIGAGKLKLVLAVLLPTVVYVIAIYFIGIYVASALFIGIFMRWQGKFTLTKIIPVSLGVSIVMFLMFEVWFLVPLPKGPLEALFGY
jgi:putative tricarboxylic transport membrane protein